MTMNAPTLAELDAQLDAAARACDWEAAERIGAEADRLAAQVAAGFTCHAAALWYASVGLPVFPLQPGSKRPYDGSHGCKDATLDPARINAWWAAAPRSNVAIATGFAVDVADLDGADGIRSWLDLADPPPILGRVKTPRPGGWHYYLAVTGQGNRAGMLPGVDFRGAGGYVVAPPSYLEPAPKQHAGVYAWRQPLEINR